jgi:lipopolysaccharide export system protein LptA
VGRRGANLELGSQPIEITADRVNADSVRNSVTFQGNVVAVQADVTLSASRVHAEYSRTAKAIERIEADGDVRVVQGDREARAPHAVFFNLEQRVVLTGGADLRQGENTLRGETITLYLRENRSVVTGGEGGGRVRAVINPKGIMEQLPR